MIEQPTQPDPIDQLLQNIARDAALEQQPLATFLQRAIARTIDTALVLAIAYGIGYVGIRFIRQSHPFNEEYIIKSMQQALPALALMIWVLIYSPVFESTGGTPGKRLVRIRLIDLPSGELPAFRYCMARSWVYMIFIILAIAPAIISCLAFFFSDFHQTWHDKLTNMICVKKS